MLNGDLKSLSLLWYDFKEYIIKVHGWAINVSIIPDNIKDFGHILPKTWNKRTTKYICFLYLLSRTKLFVLDYRGGYLTRGSKFSFKWDIYTTGLTK